jgi:hypothetical protein
MFELNVWEWISLLFGSLLVGLSKTGIAGLGIFTVAIFASVLPARESTGVLLLLLICGDLIAVPCTGGTSMGAPLETLSWWLPVSCWFFAMGQLQGDKAFQRMIGGFCWAWWWFVWGSGSSLAIPCGPTQDPPDVVCCAHGDDGRLHRWSPMRRTDHDPLHVVDATAKMDFWEQAHGSSWR